MRKKLQLSETDYQKAAVIFGATVAAGIILYVAIDQSLNRRARRKDGTFRPSGKAPKSGEELLLVSGRA